MKIHNRTDSNQLAIVCYTMENLQKNLLACRDLMAILKKMYLSLDSQTLNFEICIDASQHFWFQSYLFISNPEGGGGGAANVSA